MSDLTSQAVYVDRAENFPALTGAVLPAHSFTIGIKSLTGAATISAQREVLKGIFNVSDAQPHQLIAQDTENANKQWQLTGVVVRLVAAPGGSTSGTGASIGGANAANINFLVTIAVSDPIWRSVAVNTTTWNITGTGQTQAVTPAGNIFALPKFAITPTTQRTSQYLWQRWAYIYTNVVRPLINYPVDITNGGLNTSTIIKDTTVSNQINQVGGIGVADVTIPINTPVGGGLPNAGMGIVDSEQISWTSNGGGTSLTGVVRGIGGTTAATHANAAVISRSKMLANGNDIRIVFDGAQVNYWLDGINTATTKIWIAQNWSAHPQSPYNATYPTLLTALPNSGAAVTVQFVPGRYNSTASTLRAMKASANPVFIIGTEAFTYTQSNVDLVKSQITNCQRAQKYTAFAAHGAGGNIIPIEHDIWMLYGNQLATAFDVDNTQQPLLDLHNSTNTSWVQTQFYDSTSARPAAWTGQVTFSAGQLSNTYTGNQKANANPATELGMNLINYQVANVWKAETATILWAFYHPVGITTVSMSGSKFVLNLGTWPSTAGLERYSLGTAPTANAPRDWTSVWNEAIPGVANSWTAITHNAVALGTTVQNIRAILSGTISALANNEADLQCDTVTLALDSTITPTFSLGAEQNTASYYIAATITNNLTLDYITLFGQLPLTTGTLTVDTVAKTVVLQDGSNALAYLTVSTVRNQWLTLSPNVANTLQFDDVGTGNVTNVITWNDRSL